MNIDQLVENFKTMEELKTFCSSQFKQILQLSKKIKELEDNNIELKKQSKEVVKKESIASPILLEQGSIKGQEDAKIIAQIQLKVLKDIAYDRELTLDEAKRVDLFNKILIDPGAKEDKHIKIDAKVLKNTDLLTLVENGTSS